MASTEPYALEVSPASELTFTLTRATGQDATPRCSLTLKHPGNTDEHLAFKVKTTQPRRYLVRPNQGLVAPGSAETISIILVDKDKQVLLQSFDRLGQTALDHSKDKFLVQSCCVSREFATRYNDEKRKADSQVGENAAKSAKELAEALTGMWNAVTSAASNPIFNKKLHVRHVVDTMPPPGPPIKPPVVPHEKSLQTIENMTQEQMFAEISSLRRKYDELVSFSVNLTAERDILNNTLEQTKRDLNREMSNRAALENQGGGKTMGGNPDAPKSSGMANLLMMLIVGLLMFIVGVKMSQSDQVGFLAGIPVIGGLVLGKEGVTEEL
mmetsp:Transcript_5375/g.7902  ORF Transcript_5375/g.7902 Transcript_5375/m.7902 type:complete len:326 (-) Transcript_5375:281-1258(-)